MIRDAMCVAEGGVTDAADLVTRVAKLVELADRHQADDPNLRETLLKQMRITPLDPARPAVDLLEDLLEGIRACWLLYQEYYEDDEDDDGVDEDSEESEEITESFLADVRMEAKAHAQRLL